LTYFAFVGLHVHLLYGTGIEIYRNTTANHLSSLSVVNNTLFHIIQRKS